ncbi:MAG: serine hydrolase [Phormidesmis sp.]
MAYVWYGTAIATACGLGVLLTASLNRLPEGATVRSVNRVAAEVIASQNSSQHVSQQSELSLYQAADEFAQQASVAAQRVQSQTDSTDSLERSQALRQSRVYWQQAIKKLNEIPASSGLSARAKTKQKDYQKELAVAVREAAVLRETFIADTLQDVGVNPAQMHITLCQLSETEPPLIAGELNADVCKQHQGSQLLASAASLIKVPIAIALLKKSSDDDVPLTTKLIIDTSNYTENPEGDSLEVAKEYSLQEIMSLMIQKSDNIGTNQLIDYLGVEPINQTLSDYPQTSVGHKLVGSETRPANFGSGRNQTTTDDITAMMAAIYSQKENQSIRTALARQQDRELGYTALQDIGPQVRWLGEKTGQNNLLIGTTLAMKVHQDTYLLTVAIDNSSDTFVLQQVINRLTRHLTLNGSFIDE